MPPHDIISSMYNFSSGEIFFYLFAGVPGVSSQKIGSKMPVTYFLLFSNVLSTVPDRSKAIDDYWNNAGHDLKPTFPEFHGKFSRVIPLRIYGDGADAARKFEMFSLLPILSASSSTLDTRLVLAVRNCSRTYSDCRVKISEVLAWSFEALRAPTWNWFTLFRGLTELDSLGQVAPYVGLFNWIRIIFSVVWWIPWT